MSYISCKNVTLGYEGMAVVKELNFEVNKGDYLCIVGENGSGKSTLVKTLLGLRSTLDGEIVFGDGLRKNEIGYLPQQTMVQKDFPAVVSEIVISGCLNRRGIRPFYNKAEKQMAAESMERLEITHLKDRCFRELSGGQQQRVLLARALCATDKLLLLDEPVAGLDPKVTEEMYGLIQKLNEEGVTIVMVSHDVDATMKYATHILHVGQTPLYFGTKEGYMKSQIGHEFVRIRRRKK
ncbi:MAG: metal ABC transporter ATP-binding protein [Lachnospiraceae bacterium]|nr:metal ABC transporter ATP-binding protein [Lachnospiraceae bacterium]